MELYLLRHGIAEEVASSDASRRLTDAGREKCRQAAAGLRRLDCRPTHLWTSPLVRAQETASLVLPERVAETHDVLANHPPEALCEALRTLPDDAVVLCVGHEPQLSRMVEYLLAADGAVELKKAGLAKLTFSPQRWPQSPAVLEFLLTPRQLRLLGGGD